jgi:hypothetical protein
MLDELDNHRVLQFSPLCLSELVCGGLYISNSKLEGTPGRTLATE